MFLLFFSNIGAEQYSEYKGYAESYKWDRAHEDEAPRYVFEIAMITQSIFPKKSMAQSNTESRFTNLYCSYIT